MTLPSARHAIRFDTQHPEPALQAALASGAAESRLDLSGQRAISLRTLRRMIATHRRLRSRGGALVLQGVEPEVRAFMELTRTSGAFEVATHALPTRMPAGRTTRPPHWRALFAGVVLGLAGCAPLQPPANKDQNFYASNMSQAADRRTLARGCDVADAQLVLASASTGASPAPDSTMRYSKGDRLHVEIADGPEFSGDYMVNADGSIVLPMVSAVPAVGVTNAELTDRVRTALLSAGMFQPGLLRMSIRPVQYAPIEVYVSGAVFRPGRVLINQIKDGDKQDAALAKFGDSPGERFLAAALRSAGGVRPDADLAKITLVRDGRSFALDWRGVLSGEPVTDVPLVAGDRIEVPTAPCFQGGLVRPSSITPDGVRIFMSNLTVPAASNASSAVGQYASSLPYGTRLLPALVSANCVGGALATNANRYAVLITTDPRDGETQVVQRSIEELVRSADRDQLNPYLMPNDAIACYDSNVTNIREVATTLLQVVAPYSVVKLLAN